MALLFQGNLLGCLQFISKKACNQHVHYFIRKTRSGPSYTIFVAETLPPKPGRASFSFSATFAMRQVDSGTISLPRSSGSSLSPTRWIQQDRDSGISTEADSEAELSKRQKQHQQHQQQQRPVYPFSDDEEALPLEQSPRQPAGLTAAVFTSSSYYAFQADQALSSIKELVRDENWKKTLKHKSGVMVYMLQPPKQSSKVDSKAPIFKGEAVIHGFSPQSVFYVIGMRKLWDPQ